MFLWNTKRNKHVDSSIKKKTNYRSPAAIARQKECIKKTSKYISHLSSVINKDKGDDHVNFISMIRKEFKLENYTEKMILEYLLRLRGYDYDNSTYTITKQPSKFGGFWEQSTLATTQIEDEKFCMLSLLENERFVDFVHNHAVCDKCGGT